MSEVEDHREYLGGGVYVAIENGVATLTLGSGTRNKIHLGPKVLDALNNHIKQSDDFYKNKEMNQDEIDAKRYCWLRAQNWNDNTIAAVRYPKDAMKLGYDAPSGDRLDALIDEAILPNEHYKT